MRRVGGIIGIKVNGEIQDAKGEYTYHLGTPKRESVVGNKVHGYSEKPQAPYIEGAVTDRQDLDVAALQNITNATITLELANGKVIVLREAFYAGEGTGKTDEGELAVRFEGMSAEEVR